jgi:uncharacterized protein YndB with AHSA1/START domain
MSANAASPGAPPPKRRRFRKRFWIPSALVAALLLAIAWAWWRGTRVETEIRNPANAAEGPVTQLIAQEGRTFVRTAIVVPAPPQDVWQVVTDYDSHPKFIRYVASLSSEKLDGEKVRLSGVAHSRLWGDFPIEVVVTHSERPAERAYEAVWREEGKAGLAVDRGGWTLTVLPNNESLLVFTKESEVHGYPNFLIRSILLDRVGTIVENVRDEVARRGRG